MRGELIQFHMKLWISFFLRLSVLLKAKAVLPRRNNKTIENGSKLLDHSNESSNWIVCVKRYLFIVEWEISLIYGQLLRLGECAAAGTVIALQMGFVQTLN